MIALHVSEKTSEKVVFRISTTLRRETDFANGLDYWIAPNGWKLYSRMYPALHTDLKYLFVRGSRRNEDDNILQCKPPTFCDIVAAVAAYNLHFYGLNGSPISGIPINEPSLTTLECRFCKGTGKIQLLLSSVPCECRNIAGKYNAET